VRVYVESQILSTKLFYHISSHPNWFLLEVYASVDDNLIDLI